jgi:hypothetical protein
LNLRPSGYEATEEGLQASSDSTNSSQSLDSPAGDSVPVMQAEPGQHNNFGQPVVSEPQPILEEDLHDVLLTPAQAAARFDIPEYQIRKACSEDHLEHLRVVNALWLTPAPLLLHSPSPGVGDKAGETNQPASTRRPSP